MATADTLEGAAKVIESGEVDAVVSEQYYNDGRGVDLLQRMRAVQPNAIRILVLASARREEIVKAINDAAIYQVIGAPWEPEQISLMLKRALESRELARIHRYLSRELKFADAVLHQQNELMSKTLQETYQFDKLVFCSNAMAEVCNLAKKAAATDLPVLIQGETGTGKELLARAIHLYSGRQKQLFAAQNCGALADSLLQSELFGHKRGAFTGAVSDRLGLFLAADGGTVFLDEISDTSLAVQASLLRILQEGEVKLLGTDQTRRVNVRIIAASNRQLSKLVAEGSFRRDLYYRLRGFELQIPPLARSPRGCWGADGLPAEEILRRDDRAAGAGSRRGSHPEAQILCVSRQRPRVGERDPAHGRGRRGRRVHYREASLAGDREEPPAAGSLSRDRAGGHAARP